MSRRPSPHRPGDRALLVNRLTVGDALDLLRSEGGPISPGRIAFRILCILVVSAFTARAILLGNATAWHLFLPMVAEYLVLALALPVINLVIDDETLRRDVRRSGIWLVVLLAGVVAWTTFDAIRTDRAWGSGLVESSARFARWIVDHQMHWPIIAAAVGMALALPGRVRTFQEHGPPFVPVGIGCAMRVVVALFGCFLVPALLANPGRIVWAIWAVLLLSELGALWLHWDVQTRLRKRGLA